MSDLVTYDWGKITLSMSDAGQFYCSGKRIFKRYISALNFHSPGLATVEDESGWYHIKPNGEPLYSARYKRAFGYYFGRAAVVEERDNFLETFHIDILGTPLYSARYAWCGNYQEGLCVVRGRNNKYFYITMSGDRAFTGEYLYAGDFKDGAACVKCNDGLFRHIDTKGCFINDKAFLDLGVFHKNIAPAKDRDGWFHCDIAGGALYKARYEAVEPFYNGYALVSDFNGGKKIITETGEILLSL